MKSHIEKIFYFLLLSASCSFGQVLMSGTNFEPKIQADTSRAYWAVEDISYKGFVTGTLSIVPPLTPNANANTFDGTFYYGITNNPSKLDAVRYQNLPVTGRQSQKGCW